MRIATLRPWNALALAALAGGVVAMPAEAQAITPLDVLESAPVQMTWSSASEQQVLTVPPLIRRVLPAQEAQRADETTPDLPPGVLYWPREQAQALYDVVPQLAAEGLDPDDYRRDRLRIALDSGDAAMLSQVAGAVFTQIVEDLRDGHTPAKSRVQWFMVDPDADRFPTMALMQRAVAGENLGLLFASLVPDNPDYAALRRGLALAADEADRERIRVNMDRWRWLPHSLGDRYLIVNVPEYQVRLMMNGEVARSYRAIVGKPGSTATPQLSEIVEGVIYNPTWTVPQSIVVGEGLGSRVLNNPTWAKARGYTATRGANGYVSVVQQPGPGNSLGKMKLDMPNEHAIFLHDTPSKGLFGRDLRALSHGCIRTENALELAYTMTILGEGGSIEEAVEYAASGEYTKVAFAKPVPVYIAYFTVAPDADGNLVSYPDIYNRDAPVIDNL